MTPSGRILLVDDEPRFNEIYCELLAAEGYAVESASSAEEAVRRLGEPGWDVVLLDRKLQGRMGPDTGLDLIDEIHLISPGTKVILITGYADAESVQRAFAAGVYDYLEKNSFFDEILKVKVRNALEAARERRIAALANGKREETIRKLSTEVSAEKDPHRKGYLLEELLLVLFKSIPGFERAERDLRGSDEEFDLFIPNESPDPFWHHEPSQYLLVECKNWSGKVDPREVDRFHQKLERRHGRCHLGFFIAPGGFTPGIETTLAAGRKEDIVIVVIGEEELRLLVEAGSGSTRNDLLKQFHQRSIVRG
jgi:CheY-like chemotaxis protein